MSFATFAFEEMRLPLELLTATLVFSLPFAEKKPHFYLRAICGLSVSTLLSLAYFFIFGFDKAHPRFQIMILFWYLFIGFSSPIYARLCFQIKKSDALLIGTLSFSAQNIVYSFYHIFLVELSFPWIRATLPLYILGAVLFSFLVFYTFYRIFSPVLKKSEGSLLMDSTKNILTNMFIYILSFLFLVYYQAIFQQGYSVFDKSSWFSGIMVSVLILAMEYNNISAITYAEKTKNMEELLSNGAHYYELSKEHIAIINRKCHDLKHQLKVLRTVSDEERNEYISEAEKSILFYQNLVYTENEALNTILAEKGLFCSENNIDFHCSVDDIDLSFIRLSDLYAILGNAIDNAIEYVKDQKDDALRSISLRMNQTGSFVSIQISNPLSSKDLHYYESKENLSSHKLLPSTKKDTLYHGFGLKSIRYLAEKYSGHMEYFGEDGLFTLQIILSRFG